jgi:hypothetical protein
MPRTPLRPRTPQVSVCFDDGGSLYAVAPDHANRGVRKIELPRPTAPGTRKFSELNRERQETALAAALQAAADVIAKDLFEQLTKTKAIEAEPGDSARLAEEEKLREGAMRSFDCPLKDGLAESRCTEPRKAGCSRTRCIRQEREDDKAKAAEKERFIRLHGFHAWQASQVKI